MDEYTLVLGLPHTNHRGLAEHLLLQQAGHFHWTSLARAIGTPLSALRTPAGQEVYATFYFIEERFPAHARPATFQLDDRLRFAVSLRAFKAIAAETRIVFDHDQSLDPQASDAHPWIRLATIFITPEAGNSRLKVASPAGTDFSSIARLPNDDNPYHLTREAKETRELGLLTADWQPVGPLDGFEAMYAIDIDRDTNGAGLFYFANYVTIMDRSEREAMQASPRPFSDVEIAGRDVETRRIAYFGNVSTADRIRTRVFTFVDPRDATRVAFRYLMHRDEDGELICMSEAVKALGR
jgi:probable biosynthetic protein (TIGR04098 family)